MNHALLGLLREFEGFEAEAYLCPAGVWTIGYGFTKGVKPGDTMTREEAGRRLLDEVAPYVTRVRASAPKATENQLAAMACLAYNIGEGAFLRSSVLRMHCAGDYIGAAASFLLWNKAGGQILAGLVRRREAEMRLYLTP